MENRNSVLVITLIATIVLLSWGLSSNFNRYNTPVAETNPCKEDSLREVVYNLKAELEMAEDGWDKKEQRYEDVLFEYEFGLEHLKNHHPNAYKDFHRIIGYRERYSREVEYENKKD